MAETLCKLVVALSLGTSNFSRNIIIGFLPYEAYQNTKLFEHHVL